MTTKHTLSATHREFLQKVAAAAFSNPFGKERDDLDYEIAGRSRADTTRIANDQLMSEVKAAVARTLGALTTPADSNGAGGSLLARYAESDRKLVKAALLFHTFHQYERAFDGLIQEQIAAGETEVAAPFTGQLMTELTAAGMGEDEASRYVAIFYQLRRAYYFIGRGLTGQSPCMIDLRRHLWNNVFTFNAPWYESFLCQRLEDFSTLLLGETGTGKGTVAAALGRSGFIPFDKTKRRFKESFTRAFVSINLSQYPDTLIESELFGHKKGAFTGAVESHAGVFARCSPHGAIFIDEVGDVSPPVQVKLLGVLQERAFTPVGSHETVRFSGRVIAATNKNIDDLRRTGQFRDDFYYRLCSDVITVPPLRQRLAESPDELEDLLAHVLRSIIGDAASTVLKSVRAHVERGVPKSYGWPGNVRELEQCVRRILITGHYLGDSRHLSTQTATPDGRPQTAQELMTDYCRKLYGELGTYEDVARAAGLDRRTVKKYIG